MKSSRTIREIVTRIAVCAAVLVTSLFGPGLHNLQHRIENAAQRKSADSTDPHTLCSCAFHRHCELTDQSRDDDSSSSAPSHDSHNCAICYVLGLSSTAPVLTQIEPVGDILVESLVEFREFAKSECLAETCARGPPIA